MKAAQELGGPVWVVKAQIHAGGRGKAGGVKVVKSIDDVKKEATRILGSTLVTHQTGPKGKVVNRLYIEEGSAIDKEFYLSMLVDRDTSRVAIVVSTEGGMDIEKVAHDTPDKIVTVSVDPVTGICPHHVRRVAKALGLDADLQKQMSPLLTGLYKRVHREGHEPARGQSAGRHQGQEAHLPRRQDRLRRQRAVPPSRRGGAARRHRGRREGNRGVEIRSQLRRARRLDRLHGQRRRPRHGDHGHHQALRHGAGELPRRRRQRHARKRSRRRSRSSPPIRR